MVSTSAYELACEEGRSLPELTHFEVLTEEQALSDSHRALLLPFEEEEYLPRRILRRLQLLWRYLMSTTRTVWKRFHDACNKNPWSWQVAMCTIIKQPLWYLIWILGFFQMLSLILSGLIYLFPNDLDALLDAWVFPGREASPSSYWVTHHTIPVECHSHNDYTRPVPLYSAIKAGCVSVEADIWLSEGDLLVGHNRFTLHPAVTLRSLYLDPLLDMLEKHNTRSSSLQPQQSDGRNLAGVFANNPSQTLVLLIDFKTSGNSTLRRLLEQLAPLRERGYLTRFDGVDVLHRPVTVVASGLAPFQDIVANSTVTDIFLDAPLVKLESELSCSGGEVKECIRNSNSSIPYNFTNSYYASADFRETIGKLSRNSFSQQQLADVRDQVAVAHEIGLKVRYWGTPTWPRGLRNHVWHVLAREQVDLINVDDLTGGTTQDWRKQRSWFM